MIYKVFMFNKNTELLPSGDCYDLSPGNNEPIEHIKFFLVGIPVSNQLGLMEVEKEE